MNILTIGWGGGGAILLKPYITIGVILFDGNGIYQYIVIFALNNIFTISKCLIL